MTDAALNEFSNCEAMMVEELEDLKGRLSRTSYLSEVFDSTWHEAAKRNLQSADRRKRQAESYRISELQDERGALLERLDAAVGLVETLASQTKKLRPFKETLHKLKTSEANHFRGAVFELLSLARLIRCSQAEGSIIEVYPYIGQTTKTVEARIGICKQWINFEAKSLGFSTRDIGMSEGGSSVITASEESMDQQIYDALFEKGKNQLSAIPPGESNIVLLALAFNPGKYTAPEAIRKLLLSPDALDISAVLLSEGFKSIRPPKCIRNSRLGCKRLRRQADRDFVRMLQGEA